MADFFSAKRRDLYVESIDCCDCIVIVVYCGTLLACCIEFTGKFAAVFVAWPAAETALEEPPLLDPIVVLPIKMNENKFMSISLVLWA